MKLFFKKKTRFLNNGKNRMTEYTPNGSISGMNERFLVPFFGSVLDHRSPFSDDPRRNYGHVVQSKRYTKSRAVDDEREDATRRRENRADDT